MSETTIRVRDNGPLLVQGNFELHDAEGNSYPLTEGQNVALCRCGLSGNKPFCDGSHKDRFACAPRVEPPADPS